MTDFYEIARRQLGYLLSLPERTLRSLAAVTGGLTSLLTDTLFPRPVRGTTLYRLLIGDMQRFLIERVAQIEREGEGGAATLTDDFVPRKMVGAAIETAGLLSVHFSPLWVFAIAGDAAAGSTLFLNRLVRQLKQNGVIAPEAEITRLVDLLAALQNASRQSILVLDLPPLTRLELEQLADELQDSYRQIFASTGQLLPRFEHLWQQVEKLANQEGRSVAQLGGIMTLDLATWGKKGVGTVRAVSQTGSELFGELILDSYAQTLSGLAEEGVPGYISNHMGTFLTAAAGHFRPQRRTWTESILGSNTEDGED